MILLWIFSHNWHFLHWIPLDLTENLKHERYELAPDDPTLIFKWFFPLGLNFSQSQHKNVQKKSNFPMEIVYVDFSSLIFIDSKKWTLFLAKIHVELDDSAFFGKLKPAYLKPVQTNHRKNFSTLMANANNQVLNMWFL